MGNKKRTVAIIMTVLYLICASMCVFLVSIRERCINTHKFSATLFTCLSGLAILMFRTLRGIRTRVAKYIHLTIHVIGIAFFIWGIIHAIGAPPENPTHALSSYITMVAVCVQFIVAFLLFTYLYDNQRWRLYFAPIHDIVGIWIYVCLVGCCLTGYWNIKYLLWDANEICFMCLMMLGALIVVFVVFCPFFEWDLVGKL